MVLYIAQCAMCTVHMNVFVGHLSTMVEKEAEYVGCPNLILTIPDQLCQVTALIVWWQRYDTKRHEWEKVQ